MGYNLWLELMYGIVLPIQPILDNPKFKIKHDPEDGPFDPCDYKNVLLPKKLQKIFKLKRIGSPRCGYDDTMIVAMFSVSEVGGLIEDHMFLKSGDKAISKKLSENPKLMEQLQQVTNLLMNTEDKQYPCDWVAFAEIM